jgi:endonuclease YncB( thermonuclease family)
VNLVAADPVLEYRAWVVHVMDGNTLDLEADLGSRIPMLQRCRLDGVEAPALDDPDPEERRIAALAKDFVEVLVLGKEVVVRVPWDRRDEHGRWLAVVHWRDAEGTWNNLNEDLVENDLARRC